MRGMPFFKPKKGVQFAGQNFSDGDGGGGSYTLPTATDSRLGGVKIGSGVTVQEDGTISVSPPVTVVDGLGSSSAQNALSAKMGSKLATMIGSYESSDTASNSYSVGDFFVWIDRLVEVTSAITATDTIVLGTNVKLATISSVLTLLGQNVAVDAMNNITFNTGYSRLTGTYKKRGTFNCLNLWIELPEGGITVVAPSEIEVASISGTDQTGAMCSCLSAVYTSQFIPLGYVSSYVQNGKLVILAKEQIATASFVAMNLVWFDSI